MAHADKGPRLRVVETETGQIKLYRGARAAAALDELQDDMTIYEGVRLTQVIEAAYKQGLHDGAGGRSPGRPRLDVTVESEETVADS